MSNLSHGCDAFVLGCMDHRIHHNGTIPELRKLFGVQRADVVTGAGSAKRLLDPEKAKHVLDDIEIAIRLHGIGTVILTNHTNCGAYGEAGTEERLRADLAEAARVVMGRFPSVLVQTALIRIEAGQEDWVVTSERVA